MNNDKISIVVAMWNGNHLTDRMINQLNDQNLPDDFDASLIVVDDGSDVPYEIGHFKWGSSEVLSHDTNLGCSNAWNTGIQRAILDLKSDFVIVICNDIIIDTNCIGEILYWNRREFNVSPMDLDYMQFRQQPNLDEQAFFHKGLNAHCFSILPRIWMQRYDECGYFMDTAFTGANYEDSDLWMWCMTRGHVDNYILNTCQHWGNLMYSSSRAKQENEPYFNHKWREHNIEKIFSYFIGDCEL